MGGVKNTNLGRGEEKMFPALKVSKQCPLVLLELRFREGKALGIEDTGLGSRISNEQRMEVEQKFHCV
jgi:hypothetical protein